MSKITAARFTRPTSCGSTTTATQPSAIPIAAASHFGASTQTNLSTIAATAPAQMMIRTTGRQAPRSTSSANGRVGPGNQQVDTGVIDPSHPVARARLPGHAVIERAGSEARRDRACENCSGESRAATIGGDDQERCQGDRDHERGLVKDAAQSRLFENGCDLFGRRLHGNAPERYRGTFPGRRIR